MCTFVLMCSGSHAPACSNGLNRAVVSLKLKCSSVNPIFCLETWYYFPHLNLHFLSVLLELSFPWIIYLWNSVNSIVQHTLTSAFAWFWRRFIPTFKGRLMSELFKFGSPWLQVEFNAHTLCSSLAVDALTNFHSLPVCISCRSLELLGHTTFLHRLFLQSSSATRIGPPVCFCVHA